MCVMQGNRTGLGRVAITLLLIMGTAVYSSAVRAGDLWFTAGAGVFDFVPARHAAAAMALEVRAPAAKPSWRSTTFQGFAPVIGVLANHDGGGLGYVALELPFVWDTGRWGAAALAGVGAYERGDNGLRLGPGAAQFVLGLSMSRGLENGHRVGLMYRHASNAGLRQSNPGANVLLLSWSVPFSLGGS